MHPRMAPSAACAFLLTAPLFLAAPPAAGAADGVWGGPAAIDMDSPGDAGYAQLATDAAGNAVAVWVQFDSPRLNVWANRYVAGTGWGTARLIQANTTGVAGGPQVAVDVGGNATVVWHQQDGARSNIWANRYVAGAGWDIAALIEADDLGDADLPQVAADASGNAVAVWRQRGAVAHDIWANRYAAGLGWGAPQRIEADDAGNASGPQVAVDAGGNATAVWPHSDGVRTNLWASRFDAGTGWGAAGPIEQDSAGPAVTPQVAADPAGNAVVVWSASDGNRSNIWSNQFVAGRGWDLAGLVETNDSVSAEAPQVAVDIRGNALAVWHQHDASPANISSSRYTPGRGWSVPRVIDAAGAGGAAFPQVAFDRNGDAVAVWMQDDGGFYKVYANRYVGRAGWGTAEAIGGNETTEQCEPQVAVDTSGNALVVWYQSNWSGYRVFANQFAEKDPPPLTLLSPADGTSTNVSSVWVRGITEPGATLSLNGAPVWVAANGSFAAPLFLVPGSNAIDLRAVDRSGNRASLLANVTYNDPLPALEQALAAAQAELAAAEAAQAAAAAELASAQANVSEAEARVAALEADANVTAAERDEAVADLAAALEEVAALGHDLNVSAAALGDAEAQVQAVAGELGSATANLVAASQALNATHLDLTAAQTSLANATAELSASEAQVAALEGDAHAAEAARDRASARADGANALAAIALGLAAAGAVGGFLVGRRGRAGGPAPEPPKST